MGRLPDTRVLVGSPVIGLGSTIAPPKITLARVWEPAGPRALQTGRRSEHSG
jgi:hypothetical protein